VGGHRPEEKTMGHNLLLADDSITIQKVVKIIFSGDAYNLTIVDNGDDALVRAREIIPDVMLIDAVMPGKNGYEVCCEAKKDPNLELVPILLLTGVFEPFDEAKARESGADDFIAKPFESQVLIDKVEGLIALGALRRADAPPVEFELPLVVEPPPVVEPLPIEAEAEVEVEAEAEEEEVHVESEPEPFSTPPPEEEELLIEEVTDLDDLWGMEGLEEEPEAIVVDLVIDQEEGESLEIPEGDEESESLFINEEPLAQPFQWDADTQADEMAEPFPDTPQPEDTDLASESTSLLLPTGDELEDLLVEEFSFDEDSFDVSVPFDDQDVALDVAEEELIPQRETFSEELPESEEVPIVETPQPTGAVAGEVAPLSEEQLVAALSKVSREVIERIVWEVVPNLAESLIKEEIRKIREGF
jgi:CheY-like chemotaxis protein